MSMQQHRALMVSLGTHPTVPITPQAAAQCSTCVSTRLSQHQHADNCEQACIERKTVVAGKWASHLRYSAAVHSANASVQALSMKRVHTR